MKISPDDKLLVSFCKLADSSEYVACAWDLTADDESRNHWIPFFKKNIQLILRLGADAALARGEAREWVLKRAEACRDEFNAKFDAYKNAPAAHGPVTMLELDNWRDSLLRKYGFYDPFIDVKTRENKRAMELLPDVCRELDALKGVEQLLELVRGVFAGNIFDMGSEVTARVFAEQGPDFRATRASIQPRPWLTDDFDAMAGRLLTGPTHKKAVFFVDNAGADFVLGVLPLARWLARRGTSVVLAANETPTLNDMSIHDVQQWLPAAFDAEPSLRDLPIHAVSTGTAEPLIDLAAVSPQLNAAAADADLVILEGMGRGIESNSDVQFSVDGISLAMIKDNIVAQQCGGKVFDVVCRYRPGK